MKMNQNVAQKITLNTSVAPAVQQALKMLQMTNLDLQDYLENQSLENPFLIVESVDQSLPEERRVDEFDESYQGVDESDEGSIIEKTLAHTDSLQTHILSQINTTFSDLKERYIAKLMFGLLDERGFFSVDLGMLSQKIDAPINQLEAILSRLKELDPVGVFSRDWKEAVLRHLVDMGHTEPIYSGVLECFEDIVGGRLSKVCKQLGVSEIDIYQALKIIKSIPVYPFYGENDSDPISLKVPDVIVEREGSGWNISLNTETLPKVLVDRDYFYSVKSSCSTEEEKSFIRSAFHQANWLVSAMDQRCQNVLKIVQAVVQRQTPFLEAGAKALLPMTLKDIAADTGVHESTVSRATSHKYVETPQGIYPLKYFFTQSINGSFQDYSAESIRKQIRQIIENEDKVLSDEKIATMLGHLGVDIARRTVTKYRENMSIPSSTERRRIKKIQQAK